MITIEVKTDSKTYTCVLKEPGFDELAEALALMTGITGRMQLARAGRFLVESCWKSGDPEIKKDDKLLFSASIQAASLIEAFDSDLKKN